MPFNDACNFPLCTMGFFSFQQWACKFGIQILTRRWKGQNTLLMEKYILSTKSRIQNFIQRIIPIFKYNYLYMNIYLFYNKPLASVIISGREQEKENWHLQVVNWGSEKLNDLFKIMQPTNGRAGIWIQTIWVQILYFLSVCSCLSGTLNTSSVILTATLQGGHYYSHFIVT